MLIHVFGGVETKLFVLNITISVFPPTWISNTHLLFNMFLGNVKSNFLYWAILGSNVFDLCCNF